MLVIFCFFRGLLFSCSFFFFFLDNRFFLHTKHSRGFPLSTPFRSSPGPPSSKSMSLPLSFIENQNSERGNSKKKYNKKKKMPSDRGWTGQPNRRKESQEQALELETHPLSPLQVPQTYKLTVTTFSQIAWCRSLLAPNFSFQSLRTHMCLSQIPLYTSQND